MPRGERLPSLLMGSIRSDAKGPVLYSNKVKLKLRRTQIKLGAMHFKLSDVSLRARSRQVGFQRVNDRSPGLQASKETGYNRRYD